ncbi:hypothetical protein Tco_0003901 [Tanacetum coccineum]
MSEAEPIPPTSSVTALRIPMIKKGEYDLWSMKMRQYIAITDHILWDIITNGDQATTDPASSVFQTQAHKIFVFLSTEVKGGTLKQSTADPANIPKGYTQAASSKVHTAPNYASHSDEIICSFFSQQASMPTTHDDEDLLQIDEDAMEEIDIRWQIKLKALVATDINEDMTGRKEFDAEPNMLHIGQDGLGVCWTGATKLTEYTSGLSLDGYKLRGFGIESSSSMDSDNSSGNTNSTESLYPNFQKAKGFHLVPPPTGTLTKRSLLSHLQYLTREGLNKSRVPQAVLSRSTGRPYYPRMDNRRPRTSSYSPSSRFSTTRTPYRPHRPKKIVKSIWVKKGSTVGTQAVLPQNVKESAMINSKQTWRPKGAYLDFL